MLPEETRQFVAGLRTWRCEVLNSDPHAARKDWTNLGDAWGGAQVQAMIERFTRGDGEAALWLPADVSSGQWPPPIDRAQYYLRRLPLGIYTPDLTNTAWRFDVASLRWIEHRLFHVPESDGLCSFMRGDVVRLAAKYPIPTPNQFGWGIDALFIALAYRLKLWCVRDYAFTVQHEAGRGYGDREAGEQMDAYLRGLPEGLDGEVAAILEDAGKLRC